MALDRKRRRPMTEDLDFTGGIRLHPEGRTFGSGVAQEGSESEPSP